MSITIPTVETITEKLNMAPYLVKYNGHYLPIKKITSEFIVACKNDDISMVKMWWNTKPTIMLDELTNLCYHEDLFTLICERGYLRLAQWVIKMNPEFKQTLIDEELMGDVCRLGKLHVAKWLHTLSPELIQNVSNWIFYFACENGYLKIAKWLFQVNPRYIEHKHQGLHSFWKSCANGKLNIVNGYIQFFQKNIPLWIRIHQNILINTGSL